MNTKEDVKKEQISAKAGASKRRNELFTEVIDVVGHLLISKGIPAEDAAVTGNAVAETLRENWAGQSIYFPRDKAFDLTQRNMEICQRMERGNAQELANEFGISFVQVYAINRRCRDALKNQKADK